MYSTNIQRRQNTTRICNRCESSLHSSWLVDVIYIQFVWWIAENGVSLRQSLIIWKSSAHIPLKVQTTWLHSEILVRNRQFFCYKLWFPEQYHSDKIATKLRIKQEEVHIHFIGAKLVKEDGRMVMDNSFSDRLFSIHCPWPSSLLIRNV